MSKRGRGDLGGNETSRLLPDPYVSVCICCILEVIQKY